MDAKLFSGARRAAGGRRMARARVHSSVSGESSQCSRFVECLTDCIVRRWRHDVRRHELGGGARAPRDDGQHPRRRRRHHLVHVPHQQRDPAAQVAPQTEVGGRERRNASLGYFRCQRHQFLLPELSGRAALLLGLRVTRQKWRALLGLIYLLVDIISSLPRCFLLGYQSSLRSFLENAHI